MKIRNWEAMMGDCLELMKSIPDGSIDAIITDPPFWTTACKWDSVIPFEPMWKELKRIINTNWAIVLFGSEPFSSALRMSNIKQYKYDLVWEKTRSTDFMNSKNKICARHENILIFSQWTTANWSKRKMVFNPQMEEWKPYTRIMKTDPRVNTQWLRKKSMAWIILQNNWLRYPSSIIKIWNPNNNNVHPTQKPVELIEYLIKTYTNEWETVLDFTAGSFTTAVACENTNRKWICIEQDENYFNIWIKRLWF